MQKISAYKDRKQLLIIVATNKRELLDQGIISRFKEIEINSPDREMCISIFNHYLNQYPHNLSNKIFELATQAYNAQLSCRDIENIVSEAYLKGEGTGATKILYGALVDVLNEMIEKKKEEQQKKREEEEEIKKEKEMRDLRLKEMRDTETERFRRRFICKDENENNYSLETARDSAIATVAVLKAANELKDLFRGSENKKTEE